MERTGDIGLMAGEPHQVGRTPLVDRQERLEHRRDEHRAARVRLGQTVELVRIWLSANLVVNRLSQHPATGCTAELAREPGHQCALVEPPAVGGDLGPTASVSVKCDSSSNT